ncbi:MAG: Na+/H+ antiporter NhaC [Kiritimatiellia bacterium]
MDLPFPLPLLLAVSPALVAIALALSTRKVLISLLLGTVAGAVVANLGGSLGVDVMGAVLSSISYLADAVIPGISDFEWVLAQDGNLVGGNVRGDPTSLDYSHLIITAFSLLVAATVGVMGRSGGTRALVRSMEGLAKGPRGAQVAAWLAGMLVFFDDYANCLVVGSAMGPLMDRFKVSREKLSYIVDSTAAPVASLALVSTWVGYEVGLIGDELIAAGSDASAFTVFLAALPYRFYGFFTLAFVGAVALTGRDFGPMYHAEVAARSAHRVESSDESDREGNMWTAILPVSCLVGVTFGYLIFDGIRATVASVHRQAEQAALDAGASVSQAATAGAEAGAQALDKVAWFDILGNADPYIAMFTGSAVAVTLAVLMVLTLGKLHITDVPGALWVGMKPVFVGLSILVLAWSLGNAMQHTGAAEEIKAVVGVSDTVIFRGEPVNLQWETKAAAVSAMLVVTDRLGVVVHERPIGPLHHGRGTVQWIGVVDRNALATAGRYHFHITAEHADGSTEQVGSRGEPWFPAWTLPSLVFLMAAGTAFATGTSFGTMGILLPLAIPLAFGIEGSDNGPILLGSISAVLAGSILGDHASPISDTTVLSAIGSGVDLVDHVRTQLPYALIAGLISLLVGYLPAGLGVSPWLLIPIGSAMCVGVVWFFGKQAKANELPPRPTAESEFVLFVDKPDSDAYERA